MDSQKGQSQLVTHSVMVLFAITLILTVVSSMNEIENRYENFTNDIGVKEICAMVKASAEKIYKPVGNNITVNATEDMGYAVITLPQKLGNDNYKISLYNNTISIETSETTYRCALGINATFSGISHGGKTKILWRHGAGVNTLSISNA